MNLKENEELIGRFKGRKGNEKRCNFVIISKIKDTTLKNKILRDTFAYYTIFN